MENLIGKDEKEPFRIVVTFENGGRVAVHENVSEQESDYLKLMTIALFFAKQGKQVMLTPKLTRVFIAAL